MRNRKYDGKRKGGKGRKENKGDREEGEIGSMVETEGRGRGEREEEKKGKERRGEERKDNEK